MKTLYFNFKILLLLLSILIIPFFTAFSQSGDDFCYIEQSELDDYENKNGNCNTNLNGDFAFYDDLDTYIPFFDNDPLHNPPLKTLRVNINIFQKSDGTGNYPNNQETIDGMKQIITWVNGIYHDCDPCDPIFGVTEIDDTQIRFSIGDEGSERIYFYQDDLLWNTNNPSALMNKVISTDQERGSSINLLITGYTGSPGNFTTMPSYTDLNKNHWIFMKRWNDEVVIYAAANSLAHELGHDLSMLHTYYGGGASANCNNNDEFLSDIFGEYQQSNCPHLHEWSPDACDNTIPNGDLITNNLMGGNKDNCYISPKQAGQMHRTLALTSVRRFVEKTKSEVPLVINSNETWDFDIRLYRDIVIQPGRELTLTCNVNMPYNGKIIVKQNAKLILDGATITTMDEEPWKGIEVWGDASKHQYEYDAYGNRYQGMLVLKNGAVIENAEKAITLWNPDETNSSGGIVQATGAFFFNNTKSVEFMPYQNYHPYYGNEVKMNNISYFKDCHFEVNNEYFCDNDFDTHISMIGVNGISIRRCAFYNNMTNNLGNYAINTLDAGFWVEGVCSANISPCTWIDSDLCHFEGFYKAIYAQNTGINNYTCIIKHSNFINNTYGVDLEAVGYPSIIENHFEVSSNEKDLENCEESVDGIYGLGISLYHCKGYAVEENDFEGYTGAIDNFHAGIRISNSYPPYEEIYGNTFSGVYYASDVVGINSSGEKGVTFICNKNENNTYDFHIWGGANILQFQGNSNKPAGNTFSDNALSNFWNANSSDLLLYYWYSGDQNQYPDEVNNVQPIPTSIENTCPSHYGGIDDISVLLSEDEKIQSEQVYLQNLADYNGVKGLYDGLVDGGNTETLKTEVETSWPNDMWGLRAELLSKSPHLSMEVLIETSDKTDVFPESVIFEIMAANPDALRKGELIKHLETKEDPLPTYMIDMLKQIATGVTYKTVLENQLSLYSTEMIKAVYDIVRSNLADTVDNITELRNWIDKIGGINAKKQIISSYLQEGDFSTALLLANNLPSLFNLSEEELTEHNYYMEMLNLYNIMDQQGRNIFQLDSLEISNLSAIADNSIGIAGVYAKNILSFAYGYEFCDCPYVMDSDGLKSSSAINNGKTVDDLFDINVTPNPASDWVAFNFTLPKIAGNPQITISNATGKTVKEIYLNESKGQIIWDTRDVGSGIYLYKVTANGYSKSGKIIINK